MQGAARRGSAFSAAVKRETGRVLATPSLCCPRNGKRVRFLPKSHWAIAWEGGRSRLVSPDTGPSHSSTEVPRGGGHGMYGSARKRLPSFRQSFPFCVLPIFSSPACGDARRHREKAVMKSPCSTTLASLALFCAFSARADEAPTDAVVVTPRRVLPSAIRALPPTFRSSPVRTFAIRRHRTCPTCSARAPALPSVRSAAPWAATPRSTCVASAKRRPATR